MSVAPKVHVYRSPPDAFFVNSFIIEGDRSLVLVDTQFVLSEARALIKAIAALEKPLAAILITHPHPDHYNGLATVLERHPGTSVHATSTTMAGIRETAEPKRAYWTPIVGANYPQEFAFPDAVVHDGETLSIDGIELKVDDFGPMECSDNTTISLPQIDAVIVSDLVYNRVHPWLAEGRSGLWLAALAKAKSRFESAQTLYAGHGEAGPASLIDDQIGYITAVRGMVAEALEHDGVLTDAGKSTVQQKTLARFSGWPLEMIVGMNVGSLAAEQRAVPPGGTGAH